MPNTIGVHLVAAIIRGRGCPLRRRDNGRRRRGLLTDQTVTGISTAFDTFTVMYFAYGLMVSTILLPRHFTNVASRRGRS